MSNNDIELGSHVEYIVRVERVGDVSTDAPASWSYPAVGPHLPATTFTDACQATQVANNLIRDYVRMGAGDLARRVTVCTRTIRRFTTDYEPSHRVESHPWGAVNDQTLKLVSA